MKRIFTLSAFALLITASIKLNAQWGLSADSMVLINGSSFGGGYVPYRYCSDGSNGVITTYIDGTHIWAQRVDSRGYIRWGAAGVAIYDSIDQPLHVDIAPDGHGGCYIAWVDYTSAGGFTHYTYLAQRLDSLGNELWPHQGLQVVFSSNFGATSLSLLANDGNSFYMGLEVGWSGGYGSIRAAKIDGNGTPLWDSAGIAVSAIGDYRGPKLVNDGYGGFEMMYWADNGQIGNIYMQRIDANGNLKWGSSGVGLNTQYTIGFPDYNITNLTNGDVAATWDGYIYHAGVYAQKLDTSGAFLWGANEIKVCDTPAGQSYPDIITDGMGGAYFAWSDARASGQPTRIYAQRLNANGVEQWQHNGIAIDTQNTYVPNPSLSVDVNNGVHVFWPSTQGSSHVALQRLDTAGNTVCNVGGVRVTPTNSSTILYGNRSVLHRPDGDIVLGYHNFGLYVQFVPNGCSFPAVVNACDSLTVGFSSSPQSATIYNFTDNSFTNSGTVSNWQWNFGDPASNTNNTSTLQNPQHTFSAGGTYTVCLKVTGYVNGATCTDSFCTQIVVIPMGIGSTQSAAIQVYPNPAKNNLVIDYNGSSKLIATLTDVYGNVVLTTNLLQQHNNINTASFAAGVYGLKLMRENGEIIGVQRVMLQK